jgi:tRNA dimethylallyltransferase
MAAILCVAGPTASGKSARAVDEALRRDGEIISVDSRQVYRGLDIGTEKISRAEMRDVPHHLIDIRDPGDPYSAGDFVRDATRLIGEITARGRLPILAGGTHFYFDALLHGLPPAADPDPALRAALDALSTDMLYARVQAADPRRAAELDPHNRRRLVRALEIIAMHGRVPPRSVEPVGNVKHSPSDMGMFNIPNLGRCEVGWIVIDPPQEELRPRIDARLKDAFDRGLVDEVRRVREAVGDARLDELGLEYRLIGGHLRAGGTERSEALLGDLSAKLWQYARRQKAWLRKLGHPMS